MSIDDSVREDAERRLAILEADVDEPYCEIAALAARLCDAPIAGIAIISQTRQCFKGAVGLPSTEVGVDCGFASRTLNHASGKVDVIEDASTSKDLAGNAYVAGAPGIRFYAGSPVVLPSDIAAGVLFVADSKSRTMTAAAETVLSALAKQAAFVVESRLRAVVLEQTIARQRKDEEDLKAQVEQIHSYSRELQVHAVRLEAINARLEALAKLDGMTGLKNHRAFQERLEFEFQRAMRYSMPLSLLLLDVDNFKQFNDTFGHLAGDEVLKTVAQVLQDNARGVDFVARYGGEEFVVILPHADEAASVAIGERLRAAIENVVWPLRSVTASFGISTLTHSMTHASDLIALADKALYGSKTAGRNRVTHCIDMGNDAK